MKAGGKMKKYFNLIILSAILSGCQIRDKSEEQRGNDQNPPTIPEEASLPAPATLPLTSSDVEGEWMKSLSVDTKWVYIQKLLNDTTIPIDSKKILIKQILLNFEKEYQIDQPTLLKVAEKNLDLNSSYVQAESSNKFLNEMNKTRNSVLIRYGIMTGEDTLQDSLLQNSAEFQGFNSRSFYKENLQNLYFGTRHRTESAAFSVIESYNRSLAIKIVERIHLQNQMMKERFLQSFANLNERSIEIKSSQIAFEVVKSLKDVSSEVGNPSVVAEIAEAVKGLVIYNARINPGSLVFNVQNFEVQEMAKRLGLGVKALGLFAGQKTKLGQELAKKSTQLLDFSYNGKVELHSDFFNDNEALIKKLSEVQNRVSEFSNGAQILANIAKDVGLEENIISACQSIADVGDKMTVIASAVLSPTPENVINSIQVVTGLSGGFQNQESRRHSKVMQKLEDIERIQKLTLFQVTEMRKDIFQIQDDLQSMHRDMMNEFWDIKIGLYRIEESNAQTQLMIADLSQQIQGVAQILEKNLNRLHIKMDHQFELVQAIKESNYMSCFDLIQSGSVDEIYSLRPSTSVSVLMAQCNQTLSRLNIESPETMMTFRDSRHDQNSPEVNYFKRILEYNPSTSWVLNPPLYAQPISDLSSDRSISRTTERLVLKEADMINVSSLYQYVWALQRLFPYLVIAEHSSDLNYEKYIQSMSEISIRSKLDQLMRLVQTSLYQQVVLSGIGWILNADKISPEGLLIPEYNRHLTQIRKILEFENLDANFYEYSYFLAINQNLQEGLFSDVFSSLRPKVSADQSHLESLVFSEPSKLPTPEEVRSGFFRYKDEVKLLLKARDLIVNLATNLELAKNKDQDFSRYIRTMIFQNSMN